MIYNFIFEKKETDINQENINTVQQTEKERQLENATIYTDAMGSQFIQMLVERSLLNVLDTTNQATMIGLGKMYILSINKSNQNTED